MTYSTFPMQMLKLATIWGIMMQLQHIFSPQSNDQDILNPPIISNWILIPKHVHTISTILEYVCSRYKQMG